MRIFQRSSFLFSVLALILVVGCSAPPQPANSLTVSDVARYQSSPPLKGGIRVTPVILENGTRQDFTPKQIGAGQTAQFRDLTTTRGPVDYSLPQVPDSISQTETPVNSFPVTPSTPTKFESVKTGWSVDLTPRIEGAFVKIRVNIERTTVEPEKGMFGEGTDPILGLYDAGFLGRKVWVQLTENLSEFQAVHTEERSIVVRALPGKSYRVPLSDETTLLIEVASR